MNTVQILFHHALYNSSSCVLTVDPSNYVELICTFCDGLQIFSACMCVCIFCLWWHSHVKCYNFTVCLKKLHPWTSLKNMQTQSYGCICNVSKSNRINLTESRHQNFTHFMYHKFNTKGIFRLFTKDVFPVQDILVYNSTNVSTESIYMGDLGFCSMCNSEV
jgi:hypothetical protein